MSRAFLILASDAQRTRAADWIRRAPVGTRVEFRGPKRSLEQNALMWAMLTDVACQKEHHGRKYTAEEWKCIFMAALGSEMKFIPNLAGDGFIAYGYRSSDLSKEEMSSLIDFIQAWAAENGVALHDPSISHSEAA